VTNALESSSLLSFTRNSSRKAILIVLDEPGNIAIKLNASIENGASAGRSQKKKPRRSPGGDRKPVRVVSF
jgi:hypothetical protein